MPGYDDIGAAASQAGFTVIQTEPYFIQDNLRDNFLYVGKNRPQLYLNEPVRNGSSSFAALATRDEVASGLLRLTHDLETGAFQTVKDRCQNNSGDYLFITLKKGSRL